MTVIRSHPSSIRTARVKALHLPNRAGVRVLPISPARYFWRLLCGRCTLCGVKVIPLHALWVSPRKKFLDAPYCLSCFERRIGRKHIYVLRQSIAIERVR